MTAAGSKPSWIASGRAGEQRPGHDAEPAHVDQGLAGQPSVTVLVHAEARRAPMARRHRPGVRTTASAPVAPWTSTTQGGPLDRATSRRAASSTGRRTGRGATDWQHGVATRPTPGAAGRRSPACPGPRRRPAGAPLSRRRRCDVGVGHRIVPGGALAPARPACAAAPSGGFCLRSSRRRRFGPPPWIKSRQPVAVTDALADAAPPGSGAAHVGGRRPPHPARRGGARAGRHGLRRRAGRRGAGGRWPPGSSPWRCRSAPSTPTITATGCGQRQRAGRRVGPVVGWWGGTGPRRGWSSGRRWAGTVTCSGRTPTNCVRWPHAGAALASPVRGADGKRRVPVPRREGRPLVDDASLDALVASVTPVRGARAHDHGASRRPGWRTATPGDAAELAKHAAAWLAERGVEVRCLADDAEASPHGLLPRGAARSVPGPPRRGDLARRRRHHAAHGRSRVRGGRRRARRERGPAGLSRRGRGRRSRPSSWGWSRAATRSTSGWCSRST